MLSRVGSDAILYAGATFIARGTMLVLVPLLSRALAPAELGFVDVLVAMTTLANVTVSLEINQALARFLPPAHESVDRSRIASTSLWVTVFGFSILLGLGVLAAEPIAIAVAGSADAATTVRWAAAAAWVGGLFLLVHNQLRYQFRPRRYGTAAVAAAATTLIVTTVALTLWQAGPTSVFAGQLAGGLAGLLVALPVTVRLYRFVIDGATVRRMLGFSLPLVPASIGVVAGLYADRFLLASLGSLDAVGVYGIGSRIAAVVGLLMVGLQMALTPVIYAVHEDAATPVALARLFRQSLAVALPGGLALALFAPELVTLLSTPAYAGAAVVVGPLVAAAVLGGLTVFAPGLTIVGRTGMFALVAIGGVAVDVALSVVLIPLLGTVGAALGTLGGAAVVFTGLMLASQRHYPVPHDWPPILLGVLITVGAVLLGRPLIEFGWLGLLGRGALVAGAAVAMLALGLIRPAEVKRLRRGTPARVAP